ncbi:hypothetical protein LSAT2_010536 [Lamellibrachia satsuma]|nr:hypothetical protein LSAT2_010536 [Lamellibrachia satsuma]
MPYAIPIIFESVPNPPPRIASKRQRKERRTPELHSTSLETSETMSLSDELLAGPSSECSTPKKRKLPKEVARLQTKIVVDKLLPSEASNCQADIDRVHLFLTSVHSISD